jgi:nitroimidazol reductase NimA-like FMN-containing flavoprotein (pyridoxamine 5'-phosphate oxidase superfamily)
MEPKFHITDKTEITRLPKRGVYEKEAVYSILDEVLFCTLAYSREGQPFQIPTGFVRIDDTLYIHGSVGSFYMRELATHKYPVCISVTAIDGIVLARSAFHHSVNYRSVVIFGQPKVVNDKDELYKALEVFTEKMCPGRWAEIRKPDDGEWKATMVLSIKIDEASAKVRTGGPKDDEADYSLDIWAGVQPLKQVRLAPEPDELLKTGVPVPSYLKQ